MPNQPAIQPPPIAADAPHLRQFFISLVNESSSTLSLQYVHASTGCGWVNEPMMGEQIAPGDERIWCAMPGELYGAVALELRLHGAAGEWVQIGFHQLYPAAAEAHLCLPEDGSLLGRAELQRANSLSPFLLLRLYGALTCCET